VRARLLTAADLVDGRFRVLGRRVGHGLDADRRVSAHGDGADHDLPRRAPLDISPRTDGHGAYIGAAGPRAKLRSGGIRAQYPVVLTGLTGLARARLMGKLVRLPALGRAPEAADAEARRIPRLQTRYYAFLSYSHKDKELADWLHRELERFRVPR